MSTYEDWLTEVDTHIESALGLSVHDLPDYTWHDWFTEGVSPETTASEYISDWKYDHGLLPVDNSPQPPSSIMCFLVLVGALDRFPDLIANYDQIHVSPCVDTTKHGVTSYAVPEFTTSIYYDSGVYLVSRITRDASLYTIWSWDSVDREWSSHTIDLTL